jgi:hypothetical protein
VNSTIDARLFRYSDGNAHAAPGTILPRRQHGVGAFPDCDGSVNALWGHPIR